MPLPEALKSTPPEDPLVDMSQTLLTPKEQQALRDDMQRAATLADELLRQKKSAPEADPKLPGSKK